MTVRPGGKRANQEHQQDGAHEDEQGRPRILDFGLAALTEELIGLAPGAGGTFEYMSPEQATAYLQSGAGAVDPRSDVWALGSILFEALTGEHVA